MVRERKRTKYQHLVWFVIGVVVIGLGVVILKFAVAQVPECNGQTMSVGDTCVTTSSPGGTHSFTYDGKPQSQRDIGWPFIVVGGLMVLVNSVAGATSWSVKHRARTEL
jgi:hypothetical protein